MSHHAARHVLRLKLVTGRTRARFCNDPQIARIDEANKLPALAREERVRSFRIRATVFPRASPFTWEHRLYVRFLLNSRSRITAVTRRTTQPHRILSVFEFLKCLGRAVLVHRLD